jgi:mRNA interferase RelE/StbE
MKMYGNDQCPLHSIIIPLVAMRICPLIDRKSKDRTRKAIEERLLTTPQNYVEPLRESLKGYWKLRMGDFLQ